MDALDVLCAQLTRDLFAIAKFLLISSFRGQHLPRRHYACLEPLTRSSAVAKRPRDASCLYSFNTKRRAQSFIVSCFGFRYTTAYN